ncbi:non-specific serine/threonine protein kinase [Malassezia sp. CBS 17886]|nr:non-specific serine/threonine protein kinase [Malassezia sp. CBS 17886]
MERAGQARNEHRQPLKRARDDTSGAATGGTGAPRARAGNVDVDYESYGLADDAEDRRLAERRRRRLEIIEKHRGGREAVSEQRGPAQEGAAAAEGDASMRTSAECADPVGTAPHAASVPHADAPLVSHADVASVPHPDAASHERPRSPSPRSLGGGDEYVEIEVDDDAHIDDMFDMDDTPRPKKTIRVRKEKLQKDAQEPHAPRAATPETAAYSAVGLHDNWDDPDGYYRVMLGEKLDGGRYQVFAVLGRGIFSSVVRARELQGDGREVAIKIVRRQETMYKAGMKEIGILEKLGAQDPDGRHHIVRLFRHFEHRGHLCMVFESLSLNLREIVKRFGKDVGLSLQAVKTYAQQALVALALLRKTSIMHADLKPDNILVNESKTILKLCDLGSASSTSEMEITPYLVSRFYRAPEIILGQAYGCELDMWSIGCTLYELATGKILFPGKTNNHMLLLMQQLKGRLSSKQLKKCQFADQHFEDHNTFLSVETDRSTGEEVAKRVVIGKPLDDLRARLLPGSTAKQMRVDELRQTQQLIDLLNRMLELDPAKRITPLEALAHPFV